MRCRGVTFVAGGEWRIWHREISGGCHTHPFHRWNPLHWWLWARDAS